MSDHDATARASSHSEPPPPPARAAGAAVDAWGELLQAARITAAEQDLDLRYLAILDQPGDRPARPELIGRTDLEAYPGAVGERLAAIKRSALETRRPAQGHVDLTVGDQTRSYEVTATPRRDDQGRTVGVLSVIVDLTEVLQARERHRVSQARLGGILDSAMDAVLSAGPDRRLVYVNPAAERMFAATPAQMIGADLCAFLPEVVCDEHAAMTGSVGRGSSSARRLTVGDLRGTRATGEVFPIEVSVSCTGGGRDQLFTAIVRDRTDQDHLQKQLVQSQKLEGIGRLAGGVAHDFNNLLTVILGYCELLRMRQRGGAELEEITNAARRASQLTRQLLAFSRRQVLQVETIDLNVLVRGLNRMLRRIIGEDVTLQTDLADEPLWVVADVGQMEQVVLNLVVNARDAMPKGGRLHIATRLTEHALAHAEAGARASVTLIVTDTGVGMSEAVRSRIFEPFFTTKGDSGTGLGLATVYGIVTQTGGDVRCESEPDRGTTFQIWLPLAAPPEHADVDATGPKTSTDGHETVLLVEDEGLVRELAARALREYGYKVLEAQDVDGALGYLDHPQLAIVVSDVVMPGRSGDDLATEVARRRPELPVLLMTGYSETLLRRPIDPAFLLRKPFTPADLVAKIRGLLDRA